MIRKRKFLTFLFSIVPGVGHLYLGLNKRGLQFLIGAFVSISFIPTFPLIFPFVLTIIWFYGMFDALQKVDLMNYYLNRDGYPDGLPDSMQMFKNENTISPFWMGIGFIIVGILILWRILLPEAWSWLFQRHNSSIVLALFMIGFGVMQIYKQRKS